MFEFGIFLIIIGLIGGVASFIYCIVSMASYWQEQFFAGMIGMVISGLVETIGWVLAGASFLEMIAAHWS